MSRAEYKPDCGYGWIVVAACFLINFIMGGLVRTAGVLYVALIDIYGVSREVATMPFSIRFCVRNMSGPLAGALGQRFGIRPVVLLGGLICGLGGILSSFAPSVTWITITWGGIHGLGYGLSNIIHVIMINRYFQKYKGLALGINFTGECFGTFLLPLLLEFLLETYNLNGTFLILAGVSLNVVPAAMLLMPPLWEQHASVLSKTTDDKQLYFNNEQGIDNECFDSTLDESISCRQNDFYRNSLPFISMSEQNYYQYHESIYHMCENSQELLSSNEPSEDYFDEFYSNRKSDLLNDSLMLKQKHSLKKSTNVTEPESNIKGKRLSCQINLNRKNSQISMSSVLSCPSCVGKYVAEKVSKGHLVNSPCHHSQADTEKLHLSTNITHCKNQLNGRNSISEAAYNRNTESILHDSKVPSAVPYKSKFSYQERVQGTLHRAYEKTDTKNEMLETQEILQRNPVMRFIKTNTKPMFLIISATMALFVFLFISVFTVIIDYAADNGISSEHGKYLIIVFSVTDVIGKIGFGIVIDRKWLSMHHFASLTTGMMGLCILLVPLYKSFVFWMISFSICGLAVGGTCTMFPVLIELYMDKNEESIALGCLNFYGGLLMLPIPPMIGFFRDVMGSYDGMFWTVGALSIFAGSLWIAEPCITRQKKMEIYRNAYFQKEEKM